MSVTKANALLQCKKFQKMKILEIWAIDRTWPTLDNFTIIIFISEKNRYFKCL